MTYVLITIILSVVCAGIFLVSDANASRKHRQRIERQNLRQEKRKREWAAIQLGETNDVERKNDSHA